MLSHSGQPVHLARLRGAVIHVQLLRFGSSASKGYEVGIQPPGRVGPGSNREGADPPAGELPAGSSQPEPVEADTSSAQASRSADSSARRPRRSSARPPRDKAPRKVPSTLVRGAPSAPMPSVTSSSDTQYRRRVVAS